MRGDGSWPQEKIQKTGQRSLKRYILLGNVQKTGANQQCKQQTDNPDITKSFIIFFKNIQAEIKECAWSVLGLAALKT